MSCKSPRKTPDYTAYSVDYTKYPENKHGDHVAKLCGNVEFSKKKFRKTAGFRKCQQVDLNFVCQKLYIYLVLK
jgi:hypothetical protein